MAAKKSNRPLSPVDEHIWEKVARSVEPLEEHERQRQPGKGVRRAADEVTEGAGKNTPPAPRPKKKVARDNVSQKPQAPSTRPATPGQIDRRGQRRIAKGQTPIDSTLDLHGLTQEQAYARLNRHIMSASNAGERCILVITGKGGGGDRGGKGEGVLRRNLPDWLGNQSLGGLVSAISPAARAHGGGGAFYVRLKKQK